MLFQLTEQQQRNCLVFLGRVNLTGAEAGELVSIINALSKPMPEEKTEERVVSKENK